MRELVYLSDRKLEQFLPALRSFWPKPVVNVKTQLVEISVNAALDVEKSKLKHLAQVIAHIEKSARWFLDPQATAGQWVNFEAPLNYLMVNRGDRDLVFFVDRNVATADYPTGGSARLLLHCSSTHLRIGNRLTRVPAPPGESVVMGGGSGPDVFVEDSIKLLLKTLRSQGPPSNENQPLPAVMLASHLPSATTRLLRAIDARLYPETAAWMAGYARITASFAVPSSFEESVRYILASPLYIEHTIPPTAT